MRYFALAYDKSGTGLHASTIGPVKLAGRSIGSRWRIVSTQRWRKWWINGGKPTAPP